MKRLFLISIFLLSSVSQSYTFSTYGLKEFLSPISPLLNKGLTRNNALIEITIDHVAKVIHKALPTKKDWLIQLFYLLVVFTECGVFQGLA